ncbi:MAG: thioredoxin domain-containing protein [Vicinamibacterales bacterium]
MKPWIRVLAGLVLVCVTACSTSAQPAGQAGTTVVARVGDATITLADVDERALNQPTGNFSAMRLVDALYEARRATLEDMINGQLVQNEAKSQGLEVPALLEREVTAKVVPPTELDVAAWYKANQQRIQAGMTFEQVKDPIRNLLSQERTTTARQQYFAALRAKSPVSISLDPPRTKVDTANRPTRGPASAPIEIVEFSDFQCPFCQTAFPTVTQVLTTYGDRVRFTYRHYPLPNHPDARPAAEASACAAEQNKFWEYHDKLFTDRTLAAADLKRHATDLGLDAEKFNACVDSRKFQKDVDADVAAANSAGVNGTPAFFINGRPVSGAQPFEVFRRVIEEELARK